MNSNDSYWQKQINAYLTSGLTQSQFCQKANVRVGLFKYYYRKLHLKSIKSTPKRKVIRNKIKLTPVEVEPASITTPIHPNSLCRIQLVNGTIIELHDNRLIEQYLAKSIGLC